MKQRHSYHRLFYHLVFSTKHREHLIQSPRDGTQILEFFKVKAHDLDAYIEEFGCWREHAHLLVRSAPTVALSALYGQMKGFAAHAWIERFPDRPFGWQDGVYSITVDPYDCQSLREYIRSQWEHHESGATIERWEVPVTDQQLPQHRD
jgi:REP element-mobilizing transposase RayT